MTFVPAGLTEAHRQLLLDVAASAIEYGLQNGRCPQLDSEEYPAEVRHLASSFVTLSIAGNLRGCIGRLEAESPLVQDVARNAWSAAFRDPRFPALTPEEYPRVELHLSILTPAEPIEFESEADLVAQLRPGVDGLILCEGEHKGTLIPAFWDKVSEPALFLQYLKRKAGLSPGYWSETLQVFRYEALSIGGESKPD